MVTADVRRVSSRGVQIFTLPYDLDLNKELCFLLCMHMSSSYKSGIHVIRSNALKIWFLIKTDNLMVCSVFLRDLKQHCHFSADGATWTGKYKFVL